MLFHFHQEALEIIFTFFHKSGIICISKVIDISHGSLACDSSSPTFHKTYSAYKLSKQVTIYSLDVLLSQFWTSLLFHVWF